MMGTTHFDTAEILNSVSKKSLRQIGDTLAARGLEEFFNFFPVVLLCQFLVLAGNRFWFYLL